MAMSYKTQEAEKYRAEFAEYVTKEVNRQGWNLDVDKSRHFYVDAVFYFNSTGMDCNNYFKVMLDAITDTQLIWADDNVVCERVQRIYYDTKNPRVELTITPVKYVGIFDDVSQMEEFVSRCVGCTRYKRNCSVLKAATAGRIQEGVSAHDCSFYKRKKSD